MVAVVSDIHIFTTATIIMKQLSNLSSLRAVYIASYS